MKKYIICLFLFVVISAACLAAGYMMTKTYDQESVTGVPATELETATVPENQIAANQNQVTHQLEKEKEEFYLVAEDGFLLVFLKDKKTLYLYTHIPITDFPEKEQIRLREGIWFGSMIEVFNYLESYTS